jgi:beta-lactamase class A
MLRAGDGRITAALAVAAVLVTAGGWRPWAGRRCCADPVPSPGSTAGRSAPSTAGVAPSPVGRTSQHRPAIPKPTSASRPVTTPVTTPAAPVTTPVTAQQLAGELDEIFGAGDSYSVAVLDLSTGRSSRLGADGGMVLASLVKLDFLQTVLYQHQLSGRPLTTAQARDAEAMIERSDNAAADRIWNAVGNNSGVRRYNSLLGLHDTVLNIDGVWGLSTTSARDQLALLQALTSARSPLTAASRRYALQLMSDVESDQRWGVSAAGDPGSDGATKNGWLGIDGDGGRWAVNSAGVLRVAGHPVLMVVLSQHQPDYSTAVARVQQAAVRLTASL